MPFLPFHHWSIVAWEGENFWIIFVWYIHIITLTIMSFNTYLANGAFSRHFLHQQQLMLHFLSWQLLRISFYSKPFKTKVLTELSFYFCVKGIYEAKYVSIKCHLVNYVVSTNHLNLLGMETCWIHGEIWLPWPEPGAWLNLEARPLLEYPQAQTP